MTKKQKEQIERTLFAALESCDLDQIRTLCEEHTWLVKDHLWDRDDTWMGHAVTQNDERLMSLLLDLGFNIDAMDRRLKSTALSKAIDREMDGLVELLISRGANPDLGRAIIGTMNLSDQDRQMKYLKLLVAAGVDVNQLFPLYGDKDVLFTALDGCSDTEASRFLKKHGAKTSADSQRGDV